jgi:hypothetical protein
MSGEKGSEPRAELPHSQTDPGFDRARQNPGPGRDLEMAQAVEIGERKGFTLRMAESRKSFPNKRSRSFRTVIISGPCLSSARSPKEFDRVQAMSFNLSCAEAIDGQTARDSQQPRNGRYTARIETRGLPPHLQEDVERHFLGSGLVD